MFIHARKKQQGFTLIELVVVVILLGITSVGIAQVLSLATQNYVNSAERDQLINSARFAIERLNREIKEALPNSVRNFNVANTNCIEFVPIVGSSHYLDITNDATNQFTIIELDDIDGESATCTSSCGNVAIYTLSNNDVYVAPSQLSGQLFSVDTIATSATDNVWQVTLNNTVSIDVLSPTERVFFVEQPVRYCESNKQLFRISGYDIGIGLTDSVIPSGATAILMAENINDSSFNIQSALLTRNAVVSINLTFQSSIDSSELIPFSYEIALLNTP